MAKMFSERWEVITDLPEGGQAHVFKVVDRKGDGVTEYVLGRNMKYSEDFGILASFR
jgi:hypothetical protein